MSVSIRQLPCPDSLLRHLDPRWKLAALVPLVVVTALLRTLPAAGAALLGVLVLVLLGRLPPRWYLRRLALTGLFLAPFVLSLPFLLHAPDERANGASLSFSWYGLSMAVLLTAKAMALVSLVLVILATSPLEVTLKAAHALRVPTLLVQLFALTYRYLFLLLEELDRIRIALRVRGYRQRMTRHSYRTVSHVAGTLLVRSHERGERVGQAMRCRGFDGRYRSLTSFQTSWSDVVFCVLLLGSAGGLLYWDLSRWPL